MNSLSVWSGSCAGENLIVPLSAISSRPVEFFTSASWPLRCGAQFNEFQRSDMWSNEYGCVLMLQEFQRYWMNVNSYRHWSCNTWAQWPVKFAEMVDYKVYLLKIQVILGSRTAVTKCSVQCMSWMAHIDFLTKFFYFIFLTYERVWVEIMQF